VGEIVERQTCEIKKCPVNAVVSKWESWSACSEPCGWGTMSRTRQCTSPMYGGRKCPRLLEQTKRCRTKICPVDGITSQWSAFSACRRCGPGIQKRRRTCTRPRYGGAACDKPLVESQPCEIKKCPINAKISSWTRFGACSATCGAGTKTRTRVCTPQQFGGRECRWSLLQSRACKLKNCPVDGELTEWTTFTKCSRPCGPGKQRRSRRCRRPRFGGRACPAGDKLEVQECEIKKCPIHGKITRWTAYGACSKTCGLGVQTRTRSCIAPQFGGRPCRRLRMELTKACQVKSCPVNSIVKQWSAFGSCSLSCGPGKRVRTRTCTAARYGGIPCPPNAPPMQYSQTEACEIKKCQIHGKFTPWSAFGACTVTCGGGVQKRNRRCIGPQYGGRQCVGELLETRICNSKRCPIDGSITQWSAFRACSATCGPGTKRRNRQAVNPRYGGAARPAGPLVDVVPCNLKRCPIDGKLSAWTEYSTCNSCGKGTITRTRTCSQALYGGRDCSNRKLSQTIRCFIKNCPVDAIVNQWAAWGRCSESCGNGIQVRTRTCTGPRWGGESCPGNLREEKACMVKNCPIDGKNTQWTTYSTCSKTCGKGMQQRFRTCTQPQFGGRACVGGLVQDKSCYIARHCPIDGTLAQWSDFSACSVSCGVGTKGRNRQMSAPRYGGAARPAGPLFEVASCFLKKCPINGVISAWSAYGRCSVSCGPGKKTRTRVCTPPRFGGKACASIPLEQKANCQIKKCAVHGRVTQWSAFTTCSRVCGEGTQIKRRRCIGPRYGGNACSGDLVETRSCEIRKCAVNAIVTAWTSYSACSAKCGPGMQTRTRDCTPPMYGGTGCPSLLSLQRVCQAKPCPIDGFYKQWTSFGKCSVTCGQGIQTRTRACVQPRFGGAACVGSTKEQQNCQASPCPINAAASVWSAYGACSVTCGRGVMVRTRSCTVPAQFGGNGALCASLSQTKACTAAIPNCAVDSVVGAWSQYSSCSVTCGHGMMTRTRTCTAARYGGQACPRLTDIRDCTLQPCLTTITVTTNHAAQYQMINGKKCRIFKQANWANLHSMAYDTKKYCKKLAQKQNSSRNNCKTTCLFNSECNTYHYNVLHNACIHFACALKPVKKMPGWEIEHLTRNKCKICQKSKNQGQTTVTNHTTTTYTTTTSGDEDKKQ